MTKLTEQSNANLLLEGDVFYPRGYIVAAFEEVEQAQAASAALRHKGFSEHDVTMVSAEDMRQQAGDNIKNSSIISAIGSTVAVRHAHYALAEDGCTFMLINAPEKDQELLAIEALSSVPIIYAVKYRMLVIENLLPMIPSATPLPEPARGVGSAR